MKRTLSGRPSRARAAEARQTFKLDQEVGWSSQAAGIPKAKVGRVVEVVEAGKAPQFMTTKGVRWYSHVKHGSARDHESYVVRAGGRIYWPIVSRLRSAETLGFRSSDGQHVTLLITVRDPEEILRRFTDIEGFFTMDASNGEFTWSKPEIAENIAQKMMLACQELQEKEEREAEERSRAKETPDA